MNDKMRLQGDGVKPRRYDASTRRQAAARNRDRVLEVAETLLLRDGFAQTSIASLAAAAGVSAELIYKTFGGKTGLVREIQRRGLDGAGPVPAPERSDTVSATETDATAILRHWATLAIEVAPRTAPITQLVRAAAAVDRDMTELLEQIDAERLERMIHNAQRLIERAGVRPELEVGQIRDVLFAYTAPDLYELLVVRRRWTLAQYGDFLFHGMCGQLLA